MYSLAKLEHTELVREAVAIMKPILKDNYQIGDIHTDSAENVKFHLFASGELKGLPDIYKLTKPYPNGQRVEVHIFHEMVNISLFNILQNNHAIILLIKYKDPNSMIRFYF